MQCPSCTRQNDDHARYCVHCGASLVSGPSREERKVVSILFCDLVDSSMLGGSRDPEEWRGVVARYFGVARQEVEAYGGTVEKFIGDAVMAAFGLPVAHEDDPERAVRAACRIVRAVRGMGDIAVRVGIATGEVIADPGATEKGEFLVTGDAVNLASRLQGAAAPNTILVEGRTWRNVAQVARGDSRGQLTLKGFVRPVEAWEVQDVAAELPGIRARRLRAPLLGRDEELALLETLVHRAARDVRTTLVTIVGEAGVGKSRLFDEFGSRLPPDVRLLKGRCLPYGSSVAFSALADALKREAGIVDTDSQDAARDKLYQLAKGALAGDPEAHRLTTYIAHALGLGEGDPTFPIRREDLFDTLARLLASLARSQPVVVALEDIHWADDGLLDFLDRLTLRPPAAQLLVVCLARPQLLEQRPGWVGGRRNVSTIHLEPLPREVSGHLLVALLRGDLPPDVSSHILERAEGNPFFVEEILYMLIDDGQLAKRNEHWEVHGSEVRIPDTVQGVIAARLDQLPAREKQTAQDASIVGRLFWLQPLRRLGGEGVAESVLQLEVKELIAERPHSTIHDDREYMFRHILIRDVAYGSIPKGQRSRKHRVVADWLADVTRDRPDEFADLLAHHYEQAQMWREACMYTLRIADRAYALDTYRVALAHYARAAEFAGKAHLTPEERIHLLVQRGWTLARLAHYDQALADLVAGRELAHESGAAAWEVQALLGIGWVQGHRDDYATNQETTSVGLAIARQAQSPRLVVECLLDLGSCFHNLARVHDAVAAFNEAAAISESIGYERGMVHAMRGLAMQDAGQLQEAIAYHAQAIARVRQIGERRIEASNLNYLAGALVRAGRAQEAIQHAEIAKHLSLASGDRYREQYARRFLAYASLRLGEFARALEEGEAALEIARSLQDNEVIGYAGAILAELYGRLSDQDTALRYEQEALAAIRRVRTMPGKGSSLGDIGTARLLRRDLRGAREIFQEALTSPFVLWGPPEGHWGLGMVCLLEGALGDSLTHANALEALARPRGMSSFVARALWVRGLVAQARGTRGQCDEAVSLARASGEKLLLWALLVLTGSSEARQVFEQIGQTIPDHRLRESFRATRLF